MKRKKTSCSAHSVILLTVVLAGCGNKGPLVRPTSNDTQLLEPEVAVEISDNTEQKELKK